MQIEISKEDYELRTGNPTSLVVVWEQYFENCNILNIFAKH